MSTFEKSKPSFKEAVTDKKPLFLRFSLGQFQNAPEGPGVYWMENQSGQTLYIGKSRKLRERLLTYRHLNPNRCSAHFFEMLSYVTKVQWRPTSTEEEAHTIQQTWCDQLFPPFNLFKSNLHETIYLEVTRSEEGLSLHQRSNPTLKMSGKIYGAFPKTETSKEFFASLLRTLWRQTRKHQQFEYPAPLTRNTGPKGFPIRWGRDFPQKSQQALSIGLDNFLNGANNMFLLRSEQIPSGIEPFKASWTRKDFQILSAYYQQFLVENHGAKNHFHLLDDVINPHWQFSYFQQKVAQRH